MRRSSASPASRCASERSSKRWSMGKRTRRPACGSACRIEQWKYTVATSCENWAHATPPTSSVVSSLSKRCVFRRRGVAALWLPAWPLSSLGLPIGGRLFIGRCRQGRAAQPLGARGARLWALGSVVKDGAPAIGRRPGAFFAMKAFKVGPWPMPFRSARRPGHQQQLGEIGRAAIGCRGQCG